MKGQIARFPLGVVRLMCIRQYDERSVVDITAFHRWADAGSHNGGFNWSETPECQRDESFFADVIRRGKFYRVAEWYASDIAVFPTAGSY